MGARQEDVNGVDEERAKRREDRRDVTGQGRQANHSALGAAATSLRPQRRRSIGVNATSITTTHSQFGISKKSDNFAAEPLDGHHHGADGPSYTAGGAAAADFDAAADADAAGRRPRPRPRALSFNAPAASMDPPTGPGHTALHPVDFSDQHILERIQSEGRRASLSHASGRRPHRTGSIRTRSEHSRPRSSHYDRFETASSFHATGREAAFVSDLSNLPHQVLRRLLGLNPFKTSYFSLYRPLTDFWSRFILVLAVFCAIAAGIPIPLIAIIFSKLIDAFPPPEPQLVDRLSQLLGVAAAYFAVTCIWSVCWGIIGEKVSRGLREALVKRIVGMEQAYFDTEAPDLTSMITADTQTIQVGTSEKVGLFIQSISYFVAAFIVGFILNAKLTGILFAAVVPSLTLTVWTGSYAVSKFSKQASKIEKEASSVASGALGAVQVVQAFGANDVLASDHARILSQASKLNMRKSLSSALMLAVVFFIAYAANALAFFEGSRLSAGNAGTVFAVVLLILDSSIVVGQFGPFLQIFATAASAGSKIFEILDHPDPHIDVYSQEGVVAEDAHFKEDITLESVTFVYPARPANRVLDQVTLTIPPGTFTGICGKSGSGKSTIASLLLRLYDPSSGRIAIGDEDIRDFRVSTLRSRIAIVDQEPELFSGTVLENVSSGIVDTDIMGEEELRRRCMQAIRDANADFVFSLPKGVHTTVGSTGVSLSGGQRQRLCLARALVRQPSLLILDEATASLDATSESLILSALQRVAKSGCTIVSIAHRLATIRDADKIIVMHQGEMVEEGSHNELMASEGFYANLVQAQQMDTSNQDGSPSKISFSEHSDASRISEEKMLAATVETEPTVPAKGDTKLSMSAFQAFAKIWKACKPERPLIIIGLCASIITGGIIVGDAILFGHLISTINSITDPAQLYARADFLCLMFFVLSLVALFSYTVSGTMFGRVSEIFMRRLRDQTLRSILVQDMAWFSEPGHSPHELVAAIKTDIGHFSGLSGVIIGQIFSVLTSIIGGIVLAHVVAWKISIVLLSAVPVMVIAGFARMQVLAKSEHRHETAYNDAAAHASEAVELIRTVAAFGLEGNMVKRYQHMLKEPYEASFKFILLGHSILAFAFSIPYFVYALAYWWYVLAKLFHEHVAVGAPSSLLANTFHRGSQQVRKGAYTPLDFFIVLPALLVSAQYAGQMINVAPEVTGAKAAANNVFAMLSHVPSIMDKYDDTPAEAPSESLREKEQSNNKGTVELDNLTFAYPSRPATHVLKNVSLSIPQGSFVGVVGPSGAGKSSLISLLERFYDPVSGEVRIDGQNIRTTNVTTHRARLSLVAQDPDLFPGSIAFNISLGARPGQTVSQEDIEHACSQVGLHEFISSLPEGYTTDCGRNGSALSGGQKQRLAIARALVRNPDILILDEATSALDSHSEREVQSAIAVASEHRTTVVVAHRLSTVQHADAIFVFDGGKLVERGRHEELVALGGLYAKMVSAQDL